MLLPPRSPQRGLRIPAPFLEVLHLRLGASAGLRRCARGMTRRARGLGLAPSRYASPIERSIGRGVRRCGPI